MNVSGWISEQWHRLVRLDAHPDMVALGFSIGIFLGFTPLFGLKTLLALGVAWLCGASKVAAVIGVTLHDLLLPFVPMVLRFEYQIGFWVLSHPHHLPPKLHLHYHMHLQDLLSWTKIFSTTLPLLIGSAVIGIPLAAVSYFVVRAAHRRAIQRRAAGGLAVP